MRVARGDEIVDHAKVADITKTVVPNHAAAAMSTSIWRRARGVAHKRMATTAAAMNGADALPEVLGRVPADVVARAQQTCRASTPPARKTGTGHDSRATR